MRRFHYRLHAALTRAEHEEQSCQLDLARRQEQLRRARDRVARLSAAGADLRARLRALHRDDLDLVQVADLNRDLNHLDALLLGARSLCLDLEAAVEVARQLLLEKARERRKLETHRDDLLLRHRKAELAAEAKHLDEMAVLRPSAGRTGGPP